MTTKILTFAEVRAALADPDYCAAMIALSDSHEALRAHCADLEQDLEVAATSVEALMDEQEPLVQAVAALKRRLLAAEAANAKARIVGQIAESAYRTIRDALGENGEDGPDAWRKADCEQGPPPVRFTGKEG